MSKSRSGFFLGLGAALAAAVAVFALVANFIFANNGSDVQPTSTASPTLTREGEVGAISVVTSTGTWADVAQVIGGEWVEIQALVPDNQDPHSYEASARDQLAVSEAELVIANGGGYDEFLEQLVAASDSEPILLKLVEGEHLHGDDVQHHEGETAHDHAEEGNEHIWFDLHATLDAAESIAEAIVELRPEAQANVSANLAFFTGEIENLEIRLEALREKALGEGFIAAEGVANLLLLDAGMTNLTPEALADAVEEERDVPAAALNDAVKLLENKVARLLILNVSTSDTVSQKLLDAANKGDRPVVYVSETGFIDLGDGSEPKDLEYLDWMAWVLDQLQEAIY